MASSSSSSSSSRVSEKYHVFLSFRGEDTRDNFTSHLYATLCSKKIRTFIDDELRRGDEISQALLNAIEESMIAVIVFSEGYATSRWCLEELVKIIDCKKSRDLMVIPVFYRVDPSHVRNQKRTFREAFVKHEERFEQSLEKVLRWKSALTEAAALSGFDSKNFRTEAALIEEIVKSILERLNHLSQIDNTGLVGIQSRIKKIESLLCIESEDVFRSVGLWGMGGIGKTTLADAVFKKLSSDFESVYFQSNVREESEKFGLVRLSKELVSAILGDQSAILESALSKIWLHNKKVFIVFDDVTCSSQIEKLIGGLECFGSGSRIIITARDKQVLKNCGVSHDNVYTVQELLFDHALELFSRHAFKLQYSPTGYMELSSRVVAFAKGVPLALKVLGASLFEKTNSEWESALRKLKRNPNREIQDVLKISYDGLDDQEKNIFLNIACFLQHVPRKTVIEILDANGFDSEIGISNLIDKSLLTINVLGRVSMHDLLQKMGHKIVEQESRCPGERSRLWHHDDIYHVLRGNTGTDKIEYISLDFSKIKKINLNRNAFSKMRSLRFLDFHSRLWSDGGYSNYCECLLLDEYRVCSYCFLKEDYKLNAPQGLKFDSTYLSYVRWFRYPLPSLPSNFDMENLVALIMPGSKIKQLWNGHLYLDKLRHLNLAHSKDLIGIPELSMTPNLESLSLEGCTSLIEVPSSIQYLNKLVILNLKGCKSLSSLPTYIQSKFLRYLILSGCSSLEMAPKITCCMERVYLDGTSIIELPLTECPSRLEYLNLEDCSRLESLPSIICEIKSLGSLCVSGCSKLHNLPKDLGKLESLFKLTANNTSIRKLPCSMLSLNKLRMLCLGGYRGEDLLVDSVWPFLSDLSSLEYLDLSDCQITRLPDSLGQLSSLDSLNLSRNNFEWMPSSIQQLSDLYYLDISYC
ncbi:disease resistance-like protein DSC1 [Pistacia vera]|uniref:disease resistance-like protein DSC1 n=1 Tax=Pistacia vera TaxID=55513 RepID=UPI0012636D51|nr:disease resistance-like protein DSC1 [Pistacia vera]